MTWRSGRAYSQDLRERVLAAVDGGLRVREAAPLFRVSISYIYKALERRASTGATTPAARGGAQRKAVLAGHEAALLEHLRAQPDATLGELRRWLFETRGVGISVGALWKGLDRLGWTLKKSRSTRRNRSAQMSPPRASNGVSPSPGSTPLA